MRDGAILSHDPLTGYTQKFYHDYDPVTKKETITIKHVWNPKTVSQVLEMNKTMQNAGTNAYRSVTPGETDMWRAATIPHYVQYKWLLEEGIDICKPEHWPAVRKKLNDPEYRHLRSGDFKL